MKTKWILSGFLLLCALVACEKKLLDADIDLVADLEFTTGTYDTASEMITGEVFELGEGVKRYGHVWSTGNNPTIANNIDDDHLISDLPGPFSSRITLNPGDTYFVKAFVTDRFDSTHYGEVVQIGLPQCDVTADYTTISTATCSGYCVKFVNESENAISYIWDFGDGQSSTEVNPQHTYPAADIYNVKLTAVGDLCQDSVLDQVSVVVSTFETTYAGYSVGKSVIVTQDAFNIVGNYRVGGQDKIFFLQTNHLGQILNNAEHTTEYVLQDDDFVNDMTRLDTGDFAIVGSTKTASTDHQFYYTHSGAGGVPHFPPFIISITGGGVAPKSIARAVVEAWNGEIIGVGNTTKGSQQDIYAFQIKPNSTSSFQFSHSLGLTDGNYTPYDIVRAPGGNYALVGERTNGTSRQGFFMLLDVNGHRKSGFPKTFSSTLRSTLTAIEPISGGYYMVGQSDHDPSGDLFLLKTDNQGNVEAGFPVHIGDSGVFENVYDLLVLPSGELVIAGQKGDKAMLLKLSASGAVLWNPVPVFGGSGTNTFYAVAATPDGGFVATGTKNQTLLIVKTDGNGLVK